MGNLLQWFGPETGTSWNKTRIFRSSSETGSYSQIAELTVTTTVYFDEAGTSSDWYKIAFYDSVTLVQGPYSTAFYAASTPTLYINPTELRKFMQFSVNDFPNDEDATLLIQQAHVQIADDAAGITNSNKLKLLAFLLSSSFIARSLAMRALSKGYISVSLEGGNIMKAHDALMRLSELMYDKYQQQLAKDTVDYSATAFLANSGLDVTTIQEIKDVMNGVSDGYDYQSTYMPSNTGNRTGHY